MKTLEQKIIIAIAEAHPYTASYVEAVYKRIKSFDNTIKILEHARALGVQPLDVMSKLGIEASKAGEALRKLVLAFKELKKKPKLKQWQHPYKYHS